MDNRHFQRSQPDQVTRRALLRAMGALGAAAAAGRIYPALAKPSVPNSFTRIFSNLPAFADSSAKLTAALLDIGKPGGIMDAKDNLAAGPILLITDPALSTNNQNALMPEGAAGTTFMGQFIDHDMTFDTTSRLGVATSPRTSVNSRLPSLDLDSVYGAGPVADQLLYNPADRIKFKVESGGQFEDLPRLPDGRALIADPRNDEHVILSGLHAAFLLFHNRAVDYVRATGETDSAQIFARARKLTTWHYQWIIVNEILPSFIGQPLVSEILRRGPRFYRPDEDNGALMPVEFQGAAYRFGHSLVRPSYRANLKGDNGKPFFGLIFDPAAQGQSDPIDLRGGARASRRFIGWQTFFDFKDGELKPRKRIDTRISTPLVNLPLGAIADGTTPTSLPQRNLLRHVTWQLPSGQRVAREMDAPSLSAGDLSELSGYGVGLERSTPLWYYVLKEAEIIGGGQHLGPVGGRIVGEVILGLLQADNGSYLSADSRWTPTLPSSTGAGFFKMIDFLTFAGVSPASRGQ
ncbi:MAG: heme peroxidase family protein [Usitatibacteraceae bacterium]